MATQDDKISDKRRRLFKALSAAPVVATLRPGDALANASSLQCAANIRSDLTLNPGPVSQGSAEAGEFLYVDLMYWVLDAGGRQQRSETDPRLRGMGGIAGLPSGLPLIVVSMNQDAPGGNPIVELNGNAFIDRFSNGATFSVSGSTLTLYNQAGNATLIATGQTAGFAKVIRTGPEGGVVDRLIMDDGTYPQTQLHQFTGAGPGDPQGITGTCLGSFLTADNGRIRTLSIG